MYIDRPITLVRVITCTVNKCMRGIKKKNKHKKLRVNIHLIVFNCRNN